MEREGLSREDLAKRVGMSGAAMWRVLVGDRGVGRAFSVAIEKALGIAPSDWSRAPLRPFTLPAARVRKAHARTGTEG